MKICVAQISCIPGDIETNCARITTLAQQASDNGSDVIVFPEMVDTGYETEAIRQTASPWPGFAYNTAVEAAKTCAIGIICGLSERHKGKLYNTLAVFDAQGNLAAKYRKMHLMPLDPVNETGFLSQGKSLERLEIGDMTWGLLICYDLRFPEMSRELVSKGTQVLVTGAAWPCPRELHWEVLTRARAIENQCYMVAANRVGTDGSLTFCGQSRIIHPDGSLIAEAGVEGEELLCAEIVSESVSSLRSRFPFRGDIR